MPHAVVDDEGFSVPPNEESLRKTVDYRHHLVVVGVWDRLLTLLRLQESAGKPGEGERRSRERPAVSRKVEVADGSRVSKSRSKDIEAFGGGSSVSKPNWSSLASVSKSNWSSLVKSAKVCC